MKKQLLVTIVTLSYIFSGCSRKYDYRTDTPLGVYQLQTPDSSPDYIEYSNWVGDTVNAVMEKQPLHDIYYNDGNIAIVSCEERIDRCILTIYYSGCSVLSDAAFDFECYKGDEYLGSTTSSLQMLVGGLYSSVIVTLPEGTDSLQLKRYGAVYSGKLEKIKFYEFTDKSSIQHTSNTTYLVKDNLNLILCTEDGRIVYGCMNQPSGKCTVGRNFVAKYGVVEVE